MSLYSIWQSCTLERTGLLWELSYQQRLAQSDELVQSCQIEQGIGQQFGLDNKYNIKCKCNKYNRVQLHTTSSEHVMSQSELSTIIKNYKNMNTYESYLNFNVEI